MSSNNFGRADETCRVFVNTGAGEVEIGQYTIGTPAEALAFYERKYADLLAEADLAIARLTAGRGTADAARELATRLQAQLAAPSVVGDLAELDLRAKQLLLAAEQMQAERSAAKAAARADALAKREQIAADAESLANSTAWKQTHARFEELLAAWKALPRADREAEQALWKRFSTARQAFDRARRTHFAELGKMSTAAKAAKQALLAEAEKLATSTEWGPTTIAFRELLDRWKAAPRASKKEEDAWWERFRAAQQVFFDAKRAANEIRDEQQKGNLAAKLEVVAAAEKLLPITDVAKAKAELRKLADRFDKAGHVPRADLPKIEARWRAVADAIAEAEREEWRKSDPSRKAFAASTASKLQEAVDRLEEAVASARKQGAKNLADLEAQLANAKAMVEAAIKHA